VGDFAPWRALLINQRLDEIGAVHRVTPEHLSDVGEQRDPELVVTARSLLDRYRGRARLGRPDATDRVGNGEQGEQVVSSAV
jgi:hypothetical protein